MKVNVNHPSFVSFLENVSNSILSNVTVDNYFSQTQEKKLSLQYTVFKLMVNSLKLRAKLTDTELKNFVSILWKKNEDSENYEFAAVLNDISKNFDHVVEITKPTKKVSRKIKTDPLKKNE